MAKPDPNEIVLLVVTWAFLVVVTFRIVRWDERRLDEAGLERAWPEPSRDSALIGLSLLASPLLGLFAMTFHFVRTRRFRPRGFLLGAGALAVTLLGYVALVLALASILGLPLD